MATENQIRANRQNALKSSGPRTQKGKRKASKNSLSHGLLSADIVVPGENPDEFDVFLDRLEREYEPVGVLEGELVHQIATKLWRRRRVPRIESEILNRNVFLERASRADERARRFETQQALIFENPLERTIVTDHTEHEKAQSEAFSAREVAASDETLVGSAFINDAADHDALAKLARYEAAIDRSLYRDLHQLERLQAKRAGEVVNVPAVVDIDMSISKTPGADRRKVREVNGELTRSLPGRTSDEDMT